MTPIALTIAGTDPLAGAGVIADCIVLLEHAVAPCAVETAVIDQDSGGVYDVQPTDPALLLRRIQRTVHDTGVDCWKVGAIAAPVIAAAISDAIAGLQPAFVVVDPVLSAGGTMPGPGQAPLGDGDLVAAYLEIVRAAAAAGSTCLLTPNAVELARLLGRSAPAAEPAELSEQANALQRLTGVDVLAKGGHLRLERGTDVAVLGGAVYSLPPVWTTDADIHGTGCHLSAALVAGAALHRRMDAVVISDARTYVAGLASERYGRGRLQFSHRKR